MTRSLSPALWRMRAPSGRPNFLSAPLLVSGSDHVVCLPRRMAGLMASLAALASLDLPEAGRFTYRLIWHERTQLDPALRWVRDQLAVDD